MSSTVARESKGTIKHALKSNTVAFMYTRSRKNRFLRVDLQSYLSLSLPCALRRSTIPRYGCHDYIAPSVRLRTVPRGSPLLADDFVLGFILARPRGCVRPDDDDAYKSSIHRAARITDLFPSPYVPQCINVVGSRLRGPTLGEGERRGGEETSDTRPTSDQTRTVIYRRFYPPGSTV